MDFPSIRRLALADIDEGTLRQLTEHGESLYVERKVQPPESPRFGAAAASFANMLGGFILLGVRDDGEVAGWEPPGRSDPQSHIGELLRQEVDPLPTYVAGRRELDGKPIVVVRVFESADQPHIERGTGAIYVRSSKGKDPVDDHATVIAMARRGEQAVADAQRRIATTPDVARLFALPDSGNPLAQRDPRTAEVVARATPLTVTPSLPEWTLTRAASETCAALADRLVPPVRLQGGLQRTRQGPTLIPFGRSMTAEVLQEQGSDETHVSRVLVDSAGVVVAGIQKTPSPGEEPWLPTKSLLDEQLVPLAEGLVAMLGTAEVFGRVLADVWILVGTDEVLTTERRGSVLRHAAIHVSRDFTIPAEADEIRGLADQWHREAQREAGIIRFEDESAKSDPVGP